MAVTYATTADLEARWRPLSSGQETSTASTLLADASVFIRAECPGIDQKVTDLLVDEELLTATVCAMVKRAMVGGEDLAGVSNEQETAGPFMRGRTYSNPLGDLYLTRQERRRLGYGGVRAGNVPMAAVELFEEDEVEE
jgi:hypothetical protein